MTSKHVLMTLTLICFGDAGCGTWLGNPRDPQQPKPEQPQQQGDSTVMLRIRGEKPGAALRASSGITVRDKSGANAGTLTLTQARVVLREIRLETAAGDTEERQKFEGPYVVNLLNDIVAPDPGLISINAGTYGRLELKMHKLEKDAGILAEGDPIYDHSVHLTGTYVDAQGKSRSVTLLHDVGEEFALPLRAALAIEQGETNPIIISFKLGNWFDFTGEAVDLSDIAGAIVLDETAEDAASKVRDRIKENVKRSAEAGKDEDGDGKL